MGFLHQIIFIIVFFISNIIQGITGFAGVLLAMPISIMAIGVDQAKVILNSTAIISCLIISIRNYKNINWKELFKITSVMFVGMVIGMIIFNIISLNILLYIYAVLIILIAFKGLFVKKKISISKLVGIFVLIIAGIIHGMFVSGGALLVVYAVSALKDKDEFRATISSVWIILNTIMMFGHIKSGFFTSQIMTLILICIIPLFISIYIGNYLNKKMNQETFLKLTYILLFISGTLLLI